MLNNSTGHLFQDLVWISKEESPARRRTFFKLNLLLWWKKFTPLLWSKYLLHTPVSENLSLIIIFFWHRLHRENWIMMLGWRKLLSFVKKKNNLDGFGYEGGIWHMWSRLVVFLFSLMSLCHPWWWMDQIPLLTSLHQFEVYRSLMTAYLRIWHDDARREPASHQNSGTFQKKFCSVIWLS